MTRAGAGARRAAVLAWIALALAPAACDEDASAARHAFRQIGRAIETHDPALFHEYVDVESVASTGLKSVALRVIGDGEDRKDLAKFAGGLHDAARPLLGAYVKARIDRALLDPAPRPKPERWRFVRARKESDRTVARVETADERGERVQLDVVLAPYRGHLRVVEVDLEALLDEIEARREPR